MQAQQQNHLERRAARRTSVGLSRWARHGVTIRGLRRRPIPCVPSHPHTFLTALRAASNRINPTRLQAAVGRVSRALSPSHTRRRRSLCLSAPTVNKPLGGVRSDSNPALVHAHSTAARECTCTPSTVALHDRTCYRQLHCIGAAANPDLFSMREPPSVPTTLPRPVPPTPSRRSMHSCVGASSATGPLQQQRTDQGIGGLYLVSQPLDSRRHSEPRPIGPHSVRPRRPPLSVKLHPLLRCVRPDPCCSSNPTPLEPGLSKATPHTVESCSWIHLRPLTRPQRSHSKLRLEQNPNSCGDTSHLALPLRDSHTGNTLRCRFPHRHLWWRGSRDGLRCHSTGVWSGVYLPAPPWHLPGTSLAPRLLYRRVV